MKVQFKVLFHNHTRFMIYEKNVSVLWGDLNEDNPELNTYRNLQLKPNQKYEFVTDDPENMWARFSKIDYIENTVKGEMEIKTTQRKDWKKPNGKYLCEFLNLTQTEWRFYSQWAGNFTIYPFIPKLINLSVLNPYARFKKVEVHYVRKIDPITQTLKPRSATAVGLDIRSKAELAELEEDKEKIMKEHNLKETSFDKIGGVGIL